MTIVHKSAQSLKSVSLWSTILQYNSSEYLLSLILRMGTLIHQIVLFIFIEQTNQIGIHQRLEDVLTIHRNHILEILHLHFLQDVDSLNRGVVEIPRACGHLNDVAELFVLQAKIPIQIENGVHALEASLNVLPVLVVLQEISNLQIIV